EHDRFSAGRAEKIAGREDVNAGDFEIGGVDAAEIARVAAGQARGQHLRLLVGGFDEAVADAAVLGALADRKHVRPVGGNAIVDDDPAIDRNPARAASSALGLMPTAATTVSAASTRPSFSSTPSTWLSPMNRAVAALSNTS